MIRISFPIKFQCFLIIIMSGFILFTGCRKESNEEKSGIRAVIVTAKYCYTDYYNYFHPNSHRQDSIGVNIYFAGEIFNNTLDTIYIPNRKLGFLNNHADWHLPDESLFYTIIDGDSLFFNTYIMGQKIFPNGSEIIFNLQYYITSDKPKLLSIFKNIDKNQTLLDTMTIRYATPDMRLENGGKLLPPIVFERAKRFRIDTAEYNSYFERIFPKGSDFHENPPKEMLDDERHWDSILNPK